MIKLKFNWHDIWIGIYWRIEVMDYRKWINFWICLIPCCPIHIEWEIKR